MSVVSCGHRKHQRGCACCQRVTARYYRRRQRMLADGTWLHPVEVSVVREHIAALRASGMGFRAVAYTAGLSPSTLGGIVHDSRRVVHGPTAAAILAVQPAPSLPINLTPAIGTMRRIRALVASGYSLAEQARHLGCHTQQVWQLAWDRESTVTHDTANAVAAMFDKLSPNPGTSVRARNNGLRNGWAPPLAWDDIDDPDAVPNTGADRDNIVDPVALDKALDGQPATLTTLERHHAVHLGLDRGMSKQAIAEALRMSYAYTKELATKPLPDIYELAA